MEKNHFAKKFRKSLDSASFPEDRTCKKVEKTVRHPKDEMISKNRNKNTKDGFAKATIANVLLSVPGPLHNQKRIIDHGATTNFAARATLLKHFAPSLAKCKSRTANEFDHMEVLTFKSLHA